jgi:hypothetical protein
MTDKDIWLRYSGLIDDNGMVNGEKAVGRPVFTELLQAITKRMTASTSNDLLTERGNDWKTRFIVSESVVKGWFTTWTSEKKKKKKKKKKTVLLNDHNDASASLSASASASVLESMPPFVEDVPVSTAKSVALIDENVMPTCTSSSVPVSVEDVYVSLDEYDKSNALIDGDPEDEENTNVRVDLERAAVNDALVEALVNLRRSRRC